MKKSVIIKISAAVIAISVLLIAAWLLLRSSASVPMPTFNFLSGRGQAIHVKDAKSLRREERHVYSFAADYNDVCAAARSELSALGYVETNFPGHQPRSCDYRLRGPRSGDSVTVRILENHRFAVYSTPKNSDYSSPDKYTYHYEEGCVSVEVVQSQHQPALIILLKYYIRKIF